MLSISYRSVIHFSRDPCCIPLYVPQHGVQSDYHPRRYSRPQTDLRLVVGRVSSLRGRLFNPSLHIFPNPCTVLSISLRVLDNVDRESLLSRYFSRVASYNHLEEEPCALFIRRVYVHAEQKKVAQGKRIAVDGLDELPDRDRLSVCVLDEQLCWPLRISLRVFPVLPAL